MMHIKRLSCLSFWLWFCFSAKPTKQTSNFPAAQFFPDQRQLSALADFFRSTNGNVWRLKPREQRWNLSRDARGLLISNPCNPGAKVWVGINCTNGNITTLDLQDRGVKGPIPSSIGVLTNLVNLNLADNALGGTIPTVVGNLAQLRQLRLYRCGLTGTIPSQLARLVRVSYFGLHENGLSGAVFSGLGLVSSLLSLRLYQNALTGPLPSDIAGMKSLTYLGFDSNRFTGTIPSQLGTNSKLKVFWAGNNSLSGTIPSSFGGLSALASFAVYSNSLRGRPPLALFAVRALEFLSLRKNHFTGPLPGVLGGGNLTTLVLSSNSFTGPTSLLWTLTSLSILDVEKNKLKGRISSFIGLMTRLKFLGLGHNSLTGTIPSELGGLKTLAALNLQHNLLIGRIPQQLGSISSMQFLLVGYNMLTGPLPAVMYEDGGVRRWRMTNLENLQVGGNSLTGTLPEWVVASPSLVQLTVSSNKFTGRLPTALASAQRLQNLDVSDNMFSGPCPDFGPGQGLKVVLLSGNTFEGTIPSSICALQSTLRQLDLSANRLQGMVPAGGDGLQFLLAPRLTTVDISANHFKGAIPADVFRANLHLTAFAAASNCLSLQLPAAVCDSIGLRQLVLNGLNAGTGCSKHLWAPNNALKFDGAVARQPKQPLPKCLFSSLVNISLLHLSGNRFSASLDSVFSDSGGWPAQLTDLSLSYNLLSGVLDPALQQTMNKFTRIDLSSNKISGLLNEVAVKSSSVKSLDFSLNRFSGPLSESVVLVSNVSVLEGNLIGCDSRAALPQSDRYLPRFKCGSNQFNDYMYIFIASGGAAGILLLYSQQLSLSRTWAWLCPKNTVGLREAPLRRLIQTFIWLRQFCAVYLVLLVAVLMPGFGALSRFYGTHAYIYAWTVTAGFKTGWAATAVMLVLWTGLLTLGKFKFSKQYWVAPEDTASPSSSSSADNLSSAPTATATATAIAIKRRDVIVMLLLRGFAVSVINFFMVMLPNIVYVVVAEKQSTLGASFASFCLAIYKQFWMSVALPRILLLSKTVLHTSTDREIADMNLAYLNQPFSFELGLIAFNSVIAPAIALMVANGNCFREAFYRPPPIISHYDTTRCELDMKQTYSLKGINGSAPTWRVISQNVLDCGNVAQKTVAFRPTFQYTYQCSSALMTAYSPVVLQTILMSAFVYPLLHYLCRLYLTDIGFILQKILRLPRVMMTQQELELAQAKSLHHIEDDRHYLVLDVRAIFLGLLSDLLYMFTFGSVNPLLGVFILFAIFSKTLRWQHLLDEFASRPRPQQQPGQTETGIVIIFGVDALVSDCLKFRQNPLFSGRWFLIVFSSLFLSFFLLDTAGDAVGYKGAIPAAVLMIVLPALFSVALGKAIARVDGSELLKRRHTILIERVSSVSVSGKKKTTTRASLLQQEHEDSPAPATTTRRASSSGFGQGLSPPFLKHHQHPLSAPAGPGQARLSLKLSSRASTAAGSVSEVVHESKL